MKPIRKSGDTHHDFTEEHPAYGAIKLFQTSGAMNLTGSDFVHHHAMTIEISRATRHRSHSRDWWYSNDQLVRVHLSPAQFARFVGSVGQGEGVPCTLSCTERDGLMPPIDRDKRQTEDFRDEMSEKIGSAVQAMQAAVAALDRANNAATRKDAANMVRRALLALQNSAPFVARQFEEHIEETVDKAKAEAHAIMNAAIQDAGLSALQERARESEMKLIEDQAT